MKNSKAEDSWDDYSDDQYEEEINPGVQLVEENA